MEGGKNFSYPNLVKADNFKSKFTIYFIEGGYKFGYFRKKHHFQNAIFYWWSSFHSSTYLNTLPTDGGTTRPKKNEVKLSQFNEDTTKLHQITPPLWRDLVKKNTIFVKKHILSALVPWHPQQPQGP